MEARHYSRAPSQGHASRKASIRPGQAVKARFIFGPVTTIILAIQRGWRKTGCRYRPACRGIDEKDIATDRRKFLTGAAAVAGLTATGTGESRGPMSQPPAGGGQDGGRGGRGRGSPENVSAQKL